MRQYKTQTTNDPNQVDEWLNEAQTEHPKSFTIENLSFATVNHVSLIDVIYSLTYSFDLARENAVPLHSALKEP